jgi:hypothetical protein
MEDTKQSYDRKIERMEQTNQSYDKTMKRMEQQISELNRKIVSSEFRIRELELMVCHDRNHKIVVEYAGTKEVNGKYTQCGYENGAFKYSKNGIWDEKEGDFVIRRYNNQEWFIQFESEDGERYRFYVACTKEDVPPVDDWINIYGSGDKPFPRVNQLLAESSDSSDDE